MFTELCVSVSSQTTVHFMYGENVTLTCPVSNSMGIVSRIKDITQITDDKSDINPDLPCNKKYSVFSNDSYATMLHINMAEDCVVGKYWCETLADGDFQRFSILLKKVGMYSTISIKRELQVGHIKIGTNNVIQLFFGKHILQL